MRIATLRHIFRFGPLIWAAGFLTPLLSQTFQALDVPMPIGMPPLLAGFAIAMTLGICAQIRGRWI
ncbi:MAG: hypothetical protein CME84_08540 [Henriciella sp.]|jgi:hypothetical protein|nr:hypothetical protein [Henriciella sp.]MBF34241.1 hypothetical protein [Hyphomonadaceae bacterium]PHR75158.1 MAG: hypothetical protein COA64_12605 [Henriciella sp.]|tara:strand:- start:212 stop:409 length:198 start_codon:yes stop_codon:yes gene_type:complete